MATPAPRFNNKICTFLFYRFHLTPISGNYLITPNTSSLDVLVVKEQRLETTESYL